MPAVEGLVQLPDTRGHVWHLKATFQEAREPRRALHCKAEWTKSGDMVVDDSEAEQEVVAAAFLLDFPCFA